VSGFHGIPSWDRRNLGAQPCRGVAEASLFSVQQGPKRRLILQWIRDRFERARPVAPWTVLSSKIKVKNADVLKLEAAA